MLTFNLAPIFEARNIHKPYAFLVKAGFSPHTAHYLTSGYARSLRLDNLERLCRVLVCEPSDLFLWKPDNHMHLPDTHPLKKLEAVPDGPSLQDRISAMPYGELKKMAKGIADKKNGKDV